MKYSQKTEVTARVHMVCVLHKLFFRTIKTCSVPPINTTTAQYILVQFRDHDIIVRYHQHHNHHHHPVPGTYSCGGGGGGCGDGGGDRRDRTYITMEVDAPKNRSLYVGYCYFVLLCRV